MLRYTDQELEQMLGDIELDCAERKRSMKGDVPMVDQSSVTCTFRNA
jgi:hypothetical protein